VAHLSKEASLKGAAYRVAEGAPFGAHVDGMRLNNQPAFLRSVHRWQMIRLCMVT
jgi:hypothetical protein